jgi:hypothetical protein
MIAVQRISLPTHSAVELLLGFALALAPFALGFATVATVASLVLGAVLVGVAVGASSDAQALPLSTHLALDQWLVGALLAAVILVGFAGDRVAIAGIGAVAVAQALLITATRYSRAH